MERSQIEVHLNMVRNIIDTRKKKCKCFSMNLIQALYFAVLIKKFRWIMQIQI